MKKWIFGFIFTLPLLISHADAKGRIQNEDVKSLSDITASVLTTTGNLTSGNACIASPGSLSGLATGLFVYDTTNPTYVPSGYTITGLPGSCSAGQIQLSGNAAGTATGDTLTFGGQASQLINDTKIWVTSVNPNQQLSSAIASGVIGSSGGSKNYLSTYTASTSGGTPNTGNGNFEQGSTNGWSLGTMGALTNGLPTGTPTFGSGASGNLSISTVSGGSQIAGNYSLSYSSSTASTQGNMVASSPFYIDTEDQAKVMTVKFYYNVHSGASNDDFSGTSNNSFAWAAYDVTNSSWLGGAGNFCMTQSSGTGYCTGTFQTGTTTQQIRFVLYNANASSGATTLYLDDFVVGPQTAPFGPAMTDPVAFTPTFASIGTVTNLSAFWVRRGSHMLIYVTGVSGTVTGSTVTISLPPGFTTSSDLTASNYQVVGSLIGDATGANSWYILAQPSSNLLYVSVANGGLNPQSPATGTQSFANNARFSFFAEVPISGWSSNSAMSSDTDTRVVAAKVNLTANQSGVTSGTPTLVDFNSVENDTHAAYSTSTGLYTVPVSGYYRVSASVNLTATATGTGQISLYKNGTPYAALGQNTSLAAGFVGFGSIDGVKCNAGDTLSIYATQNSGSTQVLDGASFYTWASFTRSGGPAVIAATESVNASYQNTAGTVVGTSNTIIPFPTQYYDTHNAWNTTNANAYTAPVSGKYRISVTLTLAGTNLSTSQLFSLQVFQAGSASISKYLQQIYGNGTSESYMVTGSTDFNLLAGDTLTIQAASSVSGALNTGQGTNHFSIERVGN